MNDINKKAIQFHSIIFVCWIVSLFFIDYLESALNDDLILAGIFIVPIGTLTSALMLAIKPIDMYGVNYIRYILAICILLFPFCRGIEQHFKYGLFTGFPEIIIFGSGIMGVLLNLLIRVAFNIRHK